MNKEQEAKAIALIKRIQGQLDRGIIHMDGTGRRLATVEEVVKAWHSKLGLQVKEPPRPDLMADWLRPVEVRK